MLIAFINVGDGHCCYLFEDEQEELCKKLIQKNYDAGLVSWRIRIHSLECMNDELPLFDKIKKGDLTKTAKVVKV